MCIIAICQCACTSSLCSVGEGLVKVRETEPVLHLVLADSLNSFSAALLTDRDLLNHRMQTLLARELQHCQHLWSAANMASTNTAAIAHELLCLQGWQSLIGQTDLVELRVDVADGHVILEVEGVCHIGAVEDEVELEGEWLGPVVLGGEDEVLCAQLHGILFLGWRVGDDGDFGTECRCPHDGKVTQAAHPDDRDLLAWTGSISNKR